MTTRSDNTRKLTLVTRPEREPELSLEQTSTLWGHAFDLRGQAWPPHGEPFVDAVTRSTTRDWLQAAVLAGHLPHLEGIALALRGAHLLHLDWIRQYEADDLLGDVEAVCDMAVTYREIIALLEQQVIELEHKLAQIRGSLIEEDAQDSGPPSTNGSYPTMWAEDAQGAEARAQHARFRQRAAEDDNRQRAAERARYLPPNPERLNKQ